MKNPEFFFCCLLFCCLFGGSLPGFSQSPLPQEILQDDPIAAALDSLYTLNLFEKGYAKINYSRAARFNFAADSIPYYDESVYASRLSQIDATSPFDLQYNSIVKGYIQLYTVRRRELVSRLMALSQFYFPMFEQQLDKYNLPLELKYLAICESALNPMAKSHAGAMGLWQFMYPTGKMYGLKVSSYVDERCDPYKSTEAACQYFKYLYSLFGDWQMVLAAYNGGPGTVNKAIRRSGGKKTYWEIRPFLPTETQGYVPAFIAVNYVMNYTAEHNLYSATPKKTFLDVDTISVKKQLTFSQISTVLGIPEDELQYLNPSYRKGVIPFSANETCILTLPADKMGPFITNEERIYSLGDVVNTSETILAAQPQVLAIHRVKKGERLAAIAKNYGCTIADLKQWNNLKSNSVSPGKKLNIYSKASETPVNAVVSVEKKIDPEKEVVEKNNDTPKQTEQFKYYTIQKGDTLYKIAQKQQTTIEEIKRLNNFSTKYTLMPGKKIKVGIF
jgi:membrane-bound lytic murein transglycosylase D